MCTKKVLVALSGGVDSSVAVHLLREQGYDTEGIVLEFSPAHKATVEAAKTVAEQLDIPLHVVKCYEEFEQNVILPFCRESASSVIPPPSSALSAAKPKRWDLTGLPPGTMRGWNICRTEPPYSKNPPVWTATNPICCIA